mmetsp:Transcript_5155/g.8014  ORF Transcript_5155/g.8014 Transcript_5155/m.8014 type:complete len:204 (-) Transcript_5155:24-635(-)
MKCKAAATDCLTVASWCVSLADTEEIALTHPRLVTHGKACIAAVRTCSSGCSRRSATESIANTSPFSTTDVNAFTAAARTDSSECSSFAAIASVAIRSPFAVICESVLTVAHLPTRSDCPKFFRISLTFCSPAFLACTVKPTSAPAFNSHEKFPLDRLRLLYTETSLPTLCTFGNALILLCDLQGLLSNKSVWVTEPSCSPSE